MINFDISEKVAVITGGGGILCSTMAKELAKIGVKIAVLDIFEEMAQKVADEIVTDGGEAIAVKVDVLDLESIKSARDVVLGHFGQVDILINGAGGNKAAATTSPDLTFASARLFS